MKDFILVTVIGFCAGWLALLPAKSIGFAITASTVVILVVGLSFFAPLALFVVKLLGRKWKVLEEFGKFAAVGTLNTLLDIGVLNALMITTGIVAGIGFSGFKAISFLVGTTNSYFWNKFWTFQNSMPISVSQYSRFFLFTLVGTGINVSVASVLVNGIGAPAGISPSLWANISALIAVFTAMMWNFLSYRKIVFKGSAKKSELEGE